LIDQAYALDQVAVHWPFETQKVELVAVGHRGLHGIELCRSARSKRRAEQWMAIS
jgi:hypothetical protein